MLVVRGEAGIGKTALLEYAIESASDLRIVRAVGVESEMELAFAGLHQLCAPCSTGSNGFLALSAMRWRRHSDSISGLSRIAFLSAWRC